MAKSKLATECIAGHRLSFSLPEQPEAAIKPRPRIFIDTLNFKKAGLHVLGLDVVDFEDVKVKHARACYVLRLLSSSAA
eukprot:2682088-Pleurochrysis_carterae.AAC.1